MLRRSAPLAAALSLVGAFVGGCSPAPPNVHLDITVGQEKDTFTRDPKVVSLKVEGFAPDGSVVVTTSAAPGGTFDFGEVTNAAQLTFEVTGTDAQGATIVRGRSLGAIPLDAVTGTLRIFAQRVNEWARPPGGLDQTHVGGVACGGAERYLVLGGGQADAADEIDLYDLLTLGGVRAGGIARAPETMVPNDTAVLLVNHTGATSIDLGTGSAGDVITPSGLASYALVAGGRAIDATDGRTFVVGGTRPTEPTKSVLVAAADGSLTALNLVEARAGAAAVWIDGVGLVVAGGSATGAGVEVLGPSAKSFAAVGFPPDPTVGAGAVLDGPSGVVLIGGTLEGGGPAPIRRLDPACVNACVATVVTGSDPSVDLAGVHAYTLGGGRVFVVGDEIATPSQTRSFLLQLGVAATELPLREPRRGATVVPSPLGTLALLGGTRVDGKPALSVELLFPQ
ncbi:MAG: hypothetical protein ABJE95_04575 [Byssovorax sp.]